MQKNRRGRVGTIEIAVFAVFAIAGTAYWFLHRTPKRYNVILVSMDTTRADHLSSYGYQTPTGEKTTPNLDALAARGVRFAETHSSSSWTLPAHMSLMTGLPDQLHGVRWDLSPVDPNRKMLAQRLRDAGYQTCGFFGGPYLHRHFGFDRGFERYEPFDNVAMCYDTAPARQNIQQVRITEDQSHRWVTAKKLTTKAIDFLEHRDPDKPFFLFLQHWDAHNDYNAPEPYVKKFAPNYHGKISMKNFIENDEINDHMANEDFQWVLANYDAEINWVDDNLGHLFAELDRLNLTDDTIVVVTADHGEEFFEHKNKGHRHNLNRETLHIPLLFAGPGIRKNVTIPYQTRIFDIAPTICDLVGIETNDVECFGESLKPFLVGGDVPNSLKELPLIAELSLVPPVGANSNDPEYYYHHEAFGKLDHKLIEIRKKPFTPPNGFSDKPLKKYKSQLYRVADPDAPNESVNLTKSKPEILKRMQQEGWRIRDQLGKILKLMPVDGNAQVSPTPPSVLAALKESGYLTGAPIAVPEEDETEPDDSDVHPPFVPDSKPGGK